MRLFIALPIPQAVKQELIDLRQPIEGVRWQNENQIHLTIKFLGETEPDVARELKAQMQTISLPSISLGIKGFGYFPQGKSPKVLWARINKNDALATLHHEVEKVCEGLGFEAENRPYKPHITIARTDGAAKRDVLSFINQHKKFQQSDVSIEEFVLYESKLHSDGVKHTRLKTFQLGD